MCFYLNQRNALAYHQSFAVSPSRAFQTGFFARSINTTFLQVLLKNFPKINTRFNIAGMPPVAFPAKKWYNSSVKMIS